MRREDYYTQGRRAWFRLHEKGGKYHCVPAHHKAEAYMDAYLAVVSFAEEKNHPLFPSTNGNRFTKQALTRRGALYMIKRRATAAGLIADVCCHSFRATGITAFLSNGGTLEKAQQIAAHESPRTTKLYDRTADTIALDEIEKIAI